MSACNDMLISSAPIFVSRPRSRLVTCLPPTKWKQLLGSGVSIIARSWVHTLTYSQPTNACTPSEAFRKTATCYLCAHVLHRCDLVTGRKSPFIAQPSQTERGTALFCASNTTDRLKGSWHCTWGPGDKLPIFGTSCCHVNPAS